MPLLSTLPTASQFSIRANFKNGSSSDTAAPSAAYIKTLTGTNTDGAYWIDLPTVGPKLTYCLMNSAWNGGGWMMAMKATRGTTFNYDSAYWSAINTLNPGEYNTNDGDAKFDCFNYHVGTDIFARWPDIGSGGDISGMGMWTWLENGYSGGSRTLQNFFGTNTQRQMGRTRGAQWSGAFSSQGGFQWYGFNYQGNAGARVRWGFGWNNEGDQASNDVSGGIGMTYGVNYSAGDRIGCCQDVAGINRSARVEIYTR